MTQSTIPLAHPAPRTHSLPFFYGWLMVPLAAILAIATGPGQTFGISVFNTHLREALNLSHTQLTGAYMLGTVLACLPLTYFGFLMDRFGLRKSLVAAMVCFGCACVIMSTVSSWFTLLLAFLLLRMLGQGALSMVSNNTLAMWFEMRLGTVLGLMSVGMAAGVYLVPNLMIWLIDGYGWRQAYAILGVGIWALMVPVYLLYRDGPADVGQRIDGLDTSAITKPPEVSLNLSAARRTRAYWILMAMQISWSLIGTALMFNMRPFFESRSLGEAIGPFFATMAISLAVSQLLGGVVADRYPLRRLLFLGMLLMSASVIVLTQVNSIVMVHWFAFSFGASQGFFATVVNTVWPRYYGQKHLGAIRGSIWTATVAGSSLGPFVMGVTMDWFGSYLPSLCLFAAIYAPLAFAALYATAPDRSICLDDAVDLAQASLVEQPTQHDVVNETTAG